MLDWPLVEDATHCGGFALTHPPVHGRHLQDNVLGSRVQPGASNGEKLSIMRGAFCGSGGFITQVLLEAILPPCVRRTSLVVVTGSRDVFLASGG